MSSKSNFKIAVDTWTCAATQLKFVVITPYVIEAENKAVALAYVPNFGSPQGTLVDGIVRPDYRGDDALRDYANLNGMFYSQVNLDSFLLFNEKEFKEMLWDWGYFGSNPPDWLGNRQLKQ